MIEPQTHDDTNWNFFDHEPDQFIRVPKALVSDEDTARSIANIMAEYGHRLHGVGFMAGYDRMRADLRSLIGA